MKHFKDVEVKVIKKNEENQEKRDYPLSSDLALNGWLPNTPLKRIIQWQYLAFEFAVKAELISTRHFTGIPEENEIVTDSRGFKGIIDHLAENVTDKIKNRLAEARMYLLRHCVTAFNLRYIPFYKCENAVIVVGNLSSLQIDLYS